MEAPTINTLEATDSTDKKVSGRLPTRRNLIFLFLALLTLFTYTAPRWNDWNQNSRLNLVRSIVDRGTVQIDAFQANTGDYAYFNGHYYSDKPPGPALAGVLPYAALKLALSNPVADWAINQMGKSRTFSQGFSEGSNYGAAETTPRDKLIGALARIMLSVLLVSIPVSIMACIFWVWVCRITGRYWLSLTLTLGLVLGTTLFPYASLFYNHALTAALLFISFYLLYQNKNTPTKKTTLWLIGFILSFSLISQYETLLIAAPLVIYALATVPRSEWLRRVLWLVLGGLIPAISMVIYDFIAFGTPLPVGYQYSTLWLDKHSQGFMSLTFPHLDAIWGLTFSPYRGLFLLSPFLLLAFPGFYFGLKSATFRAEAALCLWASVAFFIFNTSSIMWWGGHAFGPRYMISCLPFMAFGVVFLLREALQKKWRGINWWFGVPVVASIAIVFPASLAGRQWPSEALSSPLTDYLWPELFSGNWARNPGTALGLKGPISFLPLLLAIGLLFLVVYRWPRRIPAGVKASGKWLRFTSTIEAGPESIKSEPNLKTEEIITKSWWRNENIFVVAVIALMLVFSSLPYLFGYLRANSGKTFMGIMLDVPDTTQYWAWMREFGQNAVIPNPLTPETNDPIFFNLLWLLLGRLQVLTGLAQEWIYQLFRVATIIFFGYIAWGFSRFIFARPLARQTAFVLIMFGSGWGWILIAIKQVTNTLSNPLAVFVAEPNTFLSALAFPHLIFSVGLILGIFWLALRAGESGQLKWALLAGVIALALGLEHTYDLIIVYGVVGVYWLYRMYRARRIDWLWLKIGLIIGLISSPPSVYFTLITMTNPTWKGVLGQYGNAGVFTPDPFNLLILIGPLLLVAFAGLLASTPPTLQPQSPQLADTRQERLKFIKVWFVVGCFLIYIPTNFQIKMLNGWQVPIFMLAVAAGFGPLATALKKIKLVKLSRSNVAICLLLIVIALPTTIYLFSWRFLDLNRTAMPYYLAKDEISAMGWLEKTSAGQPEIVLASENLGQFIAPRTGKRPFLAHWAMTLDYYTKRDLVAEVLNPQTPPEKRTQILSQYRVKYVLYGAAEKQLSPELTDSHLTKVFTSPQADIYLFREGSK